MHIVYTQIYWRNYREWYRKLSPKKIVIGSVFTNNIIYYTKQRRRRRYRTRLNQVSWDIYTILVYTHNVDDRNNFLIRLVQWHLGRPRARLNGENQININGYINFGVFDKFKSAERRVFRFLIFFFFFFALSSYLYIVLLYGMYTYFVSCAYGGNMFLFLSVS